MDAQRQAPFEPYLPRLVLDWAARTPAEPWRELDGSLVSIDLTGFTALAERLQAKGRAGAEELVLAISGVFEGLIGIANRRGGDILKFRGDALLILFSGDAHAERACRASSEMQWFIEHTGETMSSVGEVELRMSTGIYSGTCHFFLVEASHRELVVAGPAATATILLEDGAGAGEVLVSPATAAAVGPEWLAGERGGAALLALDREPDAAAPPVVEPVRAGLAGWSSSRSYPSRSAPTSGSRPARRSTGRSRPPSSSSRASRRCSRRAGRRRWASRSPRSARSSAG